MIVSTDIKKLTVDYLKIAKDQKVKMDFIDTVTQNMIRKNAIMK